MHIGIIITELYSSLGYLPTVEFKKQTALNFLIEYMLPFQNLKELNITRRIKCLVHYIHIIIS
jgi:hypothetical protein